MKRALAALAGLSLVAVTFPALADKTAVSEIPKMAAPKDATNPPKTYGVPGLSVKEQQVPRSTYTELTAATKQGYCLIESTSAFMVLVESTSSTDLSELWRFSEKDGTASLERTRFELVTYLENAWVKSKTTTELKQVANDQGVTVWAMRDQDGDFVFLAKGAEGGRETHLGRNPDDGGEVGNAISSCNYGATRISASTVKNGGGIAQLNGSLPAVGQGKDKVVPRFTVDISALKLSRDPEPEITVRVRVRNN